MLDCVRNLSTHPALVITPILPCFATASVVGAKEPIHPLVASLLLSWGVPPHFADLDSEWRIRGLHVASAIAVHLTALLCWMSNLVFQAIVFNSSFAASIIKNNL